MSSRNRVVWNEGLFIKPQHFQQQQRYMEHSLDERITSVSRYLFGLSELSLNYDYLTFGRIAIDRATGVMPDGSVFRIPQEDVAPQALEVVDASFANQLVYLCVTLRSDALMEVDWSQTRGSGRYEHRRLEVKDVHSQKGDTTSIDVSPLKMRLMLEKEDRSGFASLAIARILEKRPDGSVLLDPEFIPCHLNVGAHPPLHRFIAEMAGLMRERANNIALRIGSPSQGGVADVSDFMLLQTLNRTQPQLKHLSELRSLHPERLYECLTSLCGELSSFTDERRLPPESPSYHHELPTQSFMPLIRYLRQSLSIVLEPRAVSLQLEKRQYGVMVAPVQDPQLMSDAEFIIAVKARMPLDELRRLFVQQAKVASVEKIREHISLQLPGVPLIPLPVAPRQLPYHAGYTYYQLDKSSSLWAMFERSSGFAMHIASSFDELDVQFWAIRS
ncbi:type VI secretion system baseplate subunit TssK [Vibrio parahaemolyticus]|uniref:type VI secretion system baseplate subunit TssK n=1 Tax=Vibrio harveyi group TaxID=717610 RepID=UPI000C869CE7|nr:type VI secretion system baseplate subunit TssK [Vibrio parahaemolyticus]QLK44817.1 type VI secretion system baseplate subunit TssK [Vibrio owensii]AYO02908.1 type VI secretion system baseplate subunit TssK [Vibrio parahaemolyticus]EHK0753048.1 type VI secretion system baseplate subunit TssK [Vibrio parahaemolyticus]EHR5320105.1 type VI secretion system baseplate subunit TssK [Vibrio parahaemolyticus]EJB8454262.1 type VI secretion system baseplate subunit TssK [Vibrio parahaemolyticus]